MIDYGDTFSKSLAFIRENIVIAYSLLLLLLIPFSFFINNYLMNSSYEEAIDKIMQQKAVMAEKLINGLVQERIGDTEELQSLLNRIKEENGEIISISVLTRQKTGDFKTIASSDEKTIGKKRRNDKQSMASWGTDEPIAFRDSSNQARYWKVTRPLFDDSGKKIGLVEMLFSLEESDSRVNRIISDSYWVLLITVLVIVLLVANQARLINYAYTFTKLKEIDKMKDMFISMASHELRSPLTAIKGYVDLIQEKKDLVFDDEAKHYFENITISAERLNALVEDILEVSRIEGNRLPMEETVFDPDPVVAQSVEEIRSQAITKGLALNFKQSGAAAKIKTDSNRLKQVVINLVGNAIKYTEKGSVDVTTSVKKNEFLITVADTGFGISADDQVKLFKKFSRVTTDKTRDIIGTGLGLWITAEIVKRMQGKIAVESIEGVGSHFTVRLPLAKG